MKKSFEDANQISEKLLLAIKTEQTPDALLDALAKISLTKLQIDLASNPQKKAFWINIYNSFFQFLRKVKKLDKSKIYTEKAILIAQEKFSLDDIEHGILRKYRYKFSLGYLPNIFVRKLIKTLAVTKIDYRIHFALNCGAESCPPIAFYSVDKIEQQLNTASLSFLEGETDVFPEKNEIHISRLFQWFLADFGGKKGIKNILQEKLKLNIKNQKLIYKTYSWKEDLNNYVENSFS